MNRASDFLFFTAPAEWDELSSIRCEWSRKAEFIRTIISFASEFGLSGNPWQQWLSYVMMSQENPFTLACERQNVRENSTLMRMAEADLELFRTLYSEDLSKEGREWLRPLTEYQAPYTGYEMSEAGKRIAALSEKQAQAKDLKAFIGPLMEHYSRF